MGVWVELWTFSTFKSFSPHRTLGRLYLSWGNMHCLCFHGAHGWACGRMGRVVGFFDFQVNQLALNPPSPLFVLILFAAVCLYAGSHVVPMGVWVELWAFSTFKSISSH